MKLPVTSEAALPSPDALWRRFGDLAFDHALAIGEEMSPELARWPTNWRAVVGDDALSKDVGGTALFSVEPPASTAVADVIEAYVATGCVPPRRGLTPTESPLATAFTAMGYRCRVSHVMRVRAATVTENKPLDDVLVLPGRAARGAYADACAAWAAADPPAALRLRHLDDPQYESVVALRGRTVVAAIGLQTRGQAGLVCDLFVDAAHRRRGLATALLGRVVDLAARAQLADVFAGVASDETAVVEFFKQAGFVAVREFHEWLRPDETLPGGSVMAPSPGTPGEGGGEGLPSIE